MVTTLERLDMKHKPIMDAIRQKYGIDTNTGSFQSGYLWRNFLDIWIYLNDDMYTIKEKSEPDNTWAFPIGKDASKKRFIDKLLERTNPLFWKVRPADKDFLEANYPGMFEFEYDRDNCEYVYDADGYSELAGKWFRGYRTERNRLLREHTLRTEDIRDENMDIVKDIFRRWADKREPSGPYHTLGNETDDVVLSKFHELGMFGIILVVDEIPSAVEIGYRLSNDTCDIPMFKHVGLAKKLCRTTLREFILRYSSEYRYFNYEEDNGVEGLRESKRRMHPCRMNELWKATVRMGKS